MVECGELPKQAPARTSATRPALTARLINVLCGRRFWRATFYLKPLYISASSSKLCFRKAIQTKGAGLEGAQRMPLHRASDWVPFGALRRSPTRAPNIACQRLSRSPTAHAPASHLLSGRRHLVRLERGLLRRHHPRDRLVDRERSELAALVRVRVRVRVWVRVWMWVRVRVRVSVRVRVRVSVRVSVRVRGEGQS